jgi:glycosyltransferase involved in cell wall biosynthesis
LASVRDQAQPGRISVHHHVQDAQSTDGTLEMLQEHAANLVKDGDAPVPPAYSFSYASERDGGMYDAINKGWRAAPAAADIVAHLNCDEQYLPGALKSVARGFEVHREAEVLLADIIVADDRGEYICHRRSLQPYGWLTRFCIPTSTAATFHRVEVTRSQNVFFDTSWRNFGDKVWYNALHRAKARFVVVNEPVSLFVITGQNLNWTEEGLREKRRYEEEFLHGLTLGGQLVSWIYALRRVIKEWRLQPPREYRIYTREKNNRVTFPVQHPRGLWHQKWPIFSPEH